MKKEIIKNFGGSSKLAKVSRIGVVLVYMC